MLGSLKKGEKGMLKNLLPDINNEKVFVKTIAKVGLWIFLGCMLGGLAVLIYIYTKARSNYRNYFCR